MDDSKPSEIDIKSPIPAQKPWIKTWTADQKDFPYEESTKKAPN